MDRSWAAVGKIVTLGEVVADVYQEQTPSEVELQFTARPGGEVLLAGRVVRDGEPQGPGVRPGPPRSCSIMTEPIRRRIMQVIALRERRRPRLASVGRRPAGSM